MENFMPLMGSWSSFITPPFCIRFHTGQFFSIWRKEENAFGGGVCNAARNASSGVSGCSEIGFRRFALSGFFFIVEIPEVEEDAMLPEPPAV